MQAQNRWLLVGVLVALCAVPMGVMAQDSGDSIVILDSVVEIVFPAAVYFRVDLSANADDLNGVQLTLVQAERPLFEGIVEPLILAREGGDIRLIFDWQLDLDYAPALFETLSYEWRITFDGLEPVAQEGTVVFQPGAQEWRTSGEPPLRFAVADSVLNLSLTRQAVLPAFELMTEHTGLELELSWVVLPRDFLFCTEILDEDGEPQSIVSPLDDTDVTYPCNESDSEALLADQGYAILRRSQPGLLSFQDEVVTASFDVLYGEYWRDQQVPAWFEAGLRRYYYVNPDPLLLRQVQEASRAGLLYEAAQLARGALDTDRYDLWTAQTASIVLYIADRFGAEAPFDLAQAVTDSGFQRAFAAMTDQTWDVFLVEWERWSFTPDAARAVAWTVYLPETPTPQASSTSTLPPTATIAAEATEASTPTSTPSGVRQPGSVTALPTFTPDSGIPLTATNTPRPPGSLERPSTDQAGAVQGGAGLCGAALPAFAFPLAAFALVGRRRNEA